MNSQRLCAIEKLLLQPNRISVEITQFLQKKKQIPQQILSIIYHFSTEKLCHFQHCCLKRHRMICLSFVVVRSTSYEVLALCSDCGMNRQIYSVTVLTMIYCSDNRSIWVQLRIITDSASYIVSAINYSKLLNNCECLRV